MRTTVDKIIDYLMDEVIPNVDSGNDIFIDEDKENILNIIEEDYTLKDIPDEQKQYNMSHFSYKNAMNIYLKGYNVKRDGWKSNYKAKMKLSKEDKLAKDWIVVNSRVKKSIFRRININVVRLSKI